MQSTSSSTGVLLSTALPRASRETRITTRAKCAIRAIENGEPTGQRLAEVIKARSWPKAGDTAQFAVSGGNSTGYGWPESAERLTSRHLRSSPRSCSSSRIEASAAITPSGR